jgi:homoserine O-acetyltransferase/O-succinyltransferase
VDLSIISELEAPPVNEGLTFHYPYSFLLESGDILPEIRLNYSTYGKLNEDKSNVIWVCHALTGNSNVLEWWDGIFGKGKVYDTHRYFVICVNVLGSHYGSTNPLSVNPLTKQPYFHTFPLLTMRDITKSFELVMQHLGIEKIHTCIGGSLGGQQALEE